MLLTGTCYFILFLSVFSLPSQVDSIIFVGQGLLFKFLFRFFFISRIRNKVFSAIFFKKTLKSEQELYFSLSTQGKMDLRLQHMSGNGQLKIWEIVRKQELHSASTACPIFLHPILMCDSFCVPGVELGKKNFNFYFKTVVV